MQTSQNEHWVTLGVKSLLRVAGYKVFCSGLLHWSIDIKLRNASRTLVAQYQQSAFVEDVTWT